MKKITKEAALALMTKPVGRVSQLRAMLFNLAAGEYLLVDKRDWNWKRKSPSAMCRRVEKAGKMKFDCKKILDGSGWRIQRIDGIDPAAIGS